jgi:hypothetical protein
MPKLKSQIGAVLGSKHLRFKCNLDLDIWIRLEFRIYRGEGGL